MPIRRFQLLAFEDIMLLQEGLLEEGSLHELLCQQPDWLFPSFIFEGWRKDSTIGRPGWPAETLMGLVLLRYVEEGLSRVGAVRRARHDAQWRAALRLPWHVSPPDEKTVREFEAFLKADHQAVGEPRILVLFEHWTRLALEQGVGSDEPVVVIDSTPMWCFGAVLGTVNLLGKGLRSLARRWARARRVPLEVVATEWRAPLLLAKSTKGYFADTDWSDPASRSKVLEALMRLVTQGVEQVQDALDTVRENKRLPLLRRCKNLVRVVTEDLETTDDGSVQVVRRQSRERLISHTDPEAQHFRKSHSKVCHGFKLHVLGDAISGLIISLSVTPGGHHDSTQLHPLVARAKSLLSGLSRVLGDTAYGGIGERLRIEDEFGVDVLAPPIRTASRSAVLGKDHFDIDFEAGIVTCPGGVCTSHRQQAQSSTGQPTVAYRWEPGSEEDCSCRTQCLVHKPGAKKKNGERACPQRRLILHPHEQALRAIRDDWERPEVRAAYRQRSQGERLIREMTRRGGRRAMAFGLDNAQLQAYAIAAVNNLRLLSKQRALERTARAA